MRSTSARSNEIKRIVFTICVFISLAMVTDAAGFYRCVDSNGDVTFTDNPAPDAKCESRGGDNDVISSEQQLPPPAEFTSQTEVVAIPGTIVYVVPIQPWTPFSTMAGGGVCGKGAGIAPGTIAQVGSIIKEFHLFMRRYLRAGGMTTGKMANIGRRNKLRVFRV